MLVLRLSVKINLLQSALLTALEQDRQVDTEIAVFIT